MVIKEQKQRLPRGLACQQTNDTVHFWNQSFIELEGQIKKRSNAKDAEILSSERRVKFNGAIVRHDGTLTTISKVQHIDKMNYLDP